MAALDVDAIRRHFAFPARGRVPTNNAASTEHNSNYVPWHALCREVELAGLPVRLLLDLALTPDRPRYFDGSGFALAPSAGRARLLRGGEAPLAPADVREAMARIAARAGCHCATLAHRALGLTPPASCRLSFALYNTEAEVDRATDAVADVVREGRRLRGRAAALAGADRVPLRRSPRPARLRPGSIRLTTTPGASSRY